MCRQETTSGDIKPEIIETTEGLEVVEEQSAFKIVPICPDDKEDTGGV